MTDRELLELAAKAAGIYLTIEWLGHEKYKPDWNPLEGDGDALRLAVRLKIDIDFDAETANRNTVIAEQWDSACAASEYLLGDPYAATRRAITRAAAEIGRNMT